MISFLPSFSSCRFRLPAALASLAFVLCAGAVAAGESAEADLAALRELMSPPRPADLSPRENYLWFDQVTRRVSAAAWQLWEDHPDDPVRWEGALVMLQRRFHPRYVISIDESFPEAGEAAVHRDTAAEAAYEARLAQIEAELRDADDVPDSVREQLEFADLNQKFFPAYEAVSKGEEPDLSTIEPAFRAYLERWPESETGRGMLTSLVRLRMATAAAPTEMEVLQEYADSPNRPARQYVRDRLRFFEMAAEPFELAFTAIDGREVDLAALRGQVVLIDFWATWCGPCIAELPNVKRVYSEYQDKGFEIIGISLDRERDRQKFIDLVANEAVTWPQKFAGEGWNDEVARRYTVNAIPAMFLLDQDGRLVSTDARGEKLEQEVRRLLGIQP